MFAEVTREGCYLEKKLLDNGVPPMFENEGIFPSPRELVPAFMVLEK